MESFDFRTSAETSILVEMRSRFLLIIPFLAGLAACGLSPTGAERSTVTAAPSTTIANTTTTSSVLESKTSQPTTTSQATTTTSAPGSDRGRLVSLADLGLQPGEPIDRPEGFPPLPELDPGRYGFGSEPPHPRARISSRLEFADTLREQIDPSSRDGLQYEITYLDGVTIWDYPSGGREVKPRGDGGFLFLDEDGSWQVSDRFEWPPFGPLPEWSIVQWMAGDLVEAGLTPMGYELIAGAETVHLRWAEAPNGAWMDIWLDSSGAVMRMVVDMAGDEVEAAEKAWTIWDVLTLDPSVVGPLPPD